MRRKKAKPAGSRVSTAALKIERDRTRQTKPKISEVDEPKPVSAAPVIEAKEDQPSLTADLVASRQRGDLPAVIDLAARLRRLSPSAEPGYQMGAAALRESGALEQAATVLAAAKAGFDGRFWLLSELALLAQAGGDWPGAAAAAQALRERFPTHFLGWRIGLSALQKLDQAEEADRLLDQALHEFPQQEWPAVEALQRALRGGKMQDVARIGEALRRLRPDNPFGWKASINALRNLGRLAEAEEVTKQAAEKFPGEEWVLSTAVSLAARQGNWPEVCERAAALRLAFPTNEEGWILGIRGLRLIKRFEKATSLLEEAVLAQPGKNWLLTEAAHLSQARGDFVMAAKQWERVRETLPDQESGYIGGVQTSLALACFKEAQALLDEAQSRFTSTPLLMFEAATLAQRNGDDEEAARLWAIALVAHPHNELTYRGSYQTYRKLGKFVEADVVLRDALTHLPTSRWALTEAARFAQSRFEYAEADRRWHTAATVLPNDPDIALKYALALSAHHLEARRNAPATLLRLKALHERFPNHTQSWCSHIYFLRLQGAYLEAEQLAAERIQLTPNEPELWLQFGLAAADQDAHDQAIQRLAEAAERFQDSSSIQGAFAQILARADRLEEADRQYKIGADRFSDSADLACGYATIASRLQNWSEALRRWNLARERFPLDHRVAQGLFDVHSALGSDVAIVEQVDRVAAVKPHYAKVYEKFESLGGTGQGCEFGIVQRIAGGVEPLGLLRWTSIEPKNLIHGLESRFDGVGSPDQTVIEFFGPGEAGNPEYSTRDTRFGMRMHTFIYKKDMPEEKMLVQTCRRMTFLRRKLLEDLENGDKIFVYKIYERNLEFDELTQLYRAIRIYGNNTLLYVRYADEEHASGMVVPLYEGLLVGYISGFNMNLKGDVRVPDVHAWNSICHAALAFHKSQRPDSFKS